MCTNGREIRQPEKFVYDDTADKEALAREKFSQQRQKEMAINLQRQQASVDEDRPAMQDALVDFLLDVPEEEPTAAVNTEASKRTAKRRFQSNTNSGIRT